MSTMLETIKRNLNLVLPEPEFLIGEGKTTNEILVLGAAKHYTLPDNIQPGEIIWAVCGTDFGKRCYYQWTGESGGMENMARKVGSQYPVIEGARVRQASKEKPGVGQWIMILSSVDSGVVTNKHRLDGLGSLVWDNPDRNTTVRVSRWVPVTPAAATPVVADKIEDPVTEHDNKAQAEADPAGNVADMMRTASELLEKMEKENAFLRTQVSDLTTSRNHYQTSLSDLWEALEGKAKELEWCSDYDEFAEEHCGPARERTIYVTVEVTTRPSVTAADDVVGGLLNSEDSDLPVDVREIEIKHRVQVEMTTRVHPDASPEESEIEDALTSAGWNFTEFEYIEWSE